MTSPSSQKAPSISKPTPHEGGGSTFVPVEAFEMVIFGGTGDLARRKLIPSLYHRFVDGQFTSTSRIVAASRSKPWRRRCAARCDDGPAIKPISLCPASSMR